MMACWRQMVVYGAKKKKILLQWEVVATVTAQAHGPYLTRKDFEYNGLDIQVGDWIAGATTGTCCRIVSVPSKQQQQ